MKHLSPAEIETIRVPEPKHDPFTLESLVAWLERQPKDGTYDFFKWDRCLLAQWLQSVDTNAGLAKQAVNGFEYECNGRRLDLTGMAYIARGSFQDDDFTFSAALTRARAALASQKGNANG
jgi:hypothetical protein